MGGGGGCEDVLNGRRWRVWRYAEWEGVEVMIDHTFFPSHRLISSVKLSMDGETLFSASHGGCLPGV